MWFGNPQLLAILLVFIIISIGIGIIYHNNRLVLVFYTNIYIGIDNSINCIVMFHFEAGAGPGFEVSSSTSYRQSS